MWDFFVEFSVHICFKINKSYPVALHLSRFYYLATRDTDASQNFMISSFTVPISRWYIFGCDIAILSATVIPLKFHSDQHVPDVTVEVSKST